MTRGEKIKERRLALGMTQRELADTRMTRNMVSEIESDNATPSLTNLLYLAERLEVSPAYLLDPSMTLYADKKARWEKQIHTLFHAKKYAECLSLAENKIGSDYDSSLSYLLACACLYEAESCAAGGSVNTALSLLTRMETLIQGTDLDTSHLTARAILCRALSEDPLTPHYALDEEAYLSAVSHASGEELFHYLQNDTGYPYQSSVLQSHIEGKQLMKEYKYTEAIAVLNRIIERRLTEQISVLIIYRVYSDLETCYRERKDYENAYKCAGKKHSLLTSFRS